MKGSGEPQAAGAPLGLRERSKIRRRQAIKEAARQVFLERGYDEATTREIAERAEVSPGTLFAYAPTKSELLLMIVNDDLDEITAREFEDAAARPLIDVLLRFCESRFMYWHRLGDLAASARKEVHGVTASKHGMGPESSRFRLRNPLLMKQLADEIQRRQDSGALAERTDPLLTARLCWGVYYSEIDLWLRNPKPSLKEAKVNLRQIYTMVLRGLGASAQELGGADDKTGTRTSKASAAGGRKGAAAARRKA